ncbi:hypothetical protein GO003_007770 [Methylicorpusculum oleiharenae]|uniref:hypothetical protein n=1 Tax=Methylicorpusculum oleiharenae TaxID=1338687 RepID=UPI00135B3050|nr:hypothetical protein [Methylicorpusculum oleiharenae]MCD2450280.1 hypothetical protein [Methylicorpusculum oleiharenae]
MDHRRAERYTLIPSVTPAWIAGVQAAWIARNLPSMALDTRFPEGMTTFVYNDLPNGAGKTTFAQDYLPRTAHCRHFINADQTRCFMNHGDRPELVFRQQAGQREIYHSEFFELLQQEALQ